MLSYQTKLFILLVKKKNTKWGLLSQDYFPEEFFLNHCRSATFIPPNRFKLILSNIFLFLRKSKWKKIIQFIWFKDRKCVTWPFDHRFCIQSLKSIILSHIFQDRVPSKCVITRRRSNGGFWTNWLIFRIYTLNFWRNMCHIK